ncbi:ABC transporter permease [Gynuella sp.]|uniref:ABC transporter permease n=1 Tax=Gynuella sp. TaxID=2969146 RepID=UPI003D13DE22
MSTSTRTPLQVTWSVWKALFLREALTRLLSGRAQWFWLLLEPAFHVVYMTFIFSVVRVRHVGGIDTAIWLMMGMLAFFMFKRTWGQLTNAIDANKSLFVYRQVKPIDTVLVRAALEGIIMLFVIIILLSGLALLGKEVQPTDPLRLIGALWGLWLLGTGLGLMTSVATELIPEIGKIINLITMPLMWISGVMIPLTSIPQPYRDWLLFNPVVHGIESARLGFAGYYHTFPELDESFLFKCALVSMFFGLALHRRFALRMMMQ